MKLVIVESPAKAKTINKYLGSNYKVLASYGHVRDLPAKDGSVLPDEDFSMSWTVDSRSKPRLTDITKAAINIAAGCRHGACEQPAHAAGFASELRRNN